jgi:hypothetical protein
MIPIPFQIHSIKKTTKEEEDKRRSVRRGPADDPAAGHGKRRGLVKKMSKRHGKKQDPE